MIPSPTIGRGQITRQEDIFHAGVPIVWVVSLAGHQRLAVPKLTGDWKEGLASTEGI